MIDRGKLYVGTSGLVLPVPNKQAFPAAFRAGARLTYYASLFNSIEVNSSFYKIPQPATFSRWVDEVGPGFRFTVKLWRGITHEPGLHFQPADVGKFMHAAKELDGKRGCLLVQLPPGAHSNRAMELQRLLECITVTDAGWRIAVEFRHRSWYNSETARLLTGFQAGLVLHDMPASKVSAEAGETSFIYLRYHGVAGDYKGGYPDEVLQSDAARVRSWINEGKDVYSYFNNTIGDALVNAQTLRGFVSRP